MQCNTALVTGDKLDIASEVAGQLGIPQYYGNLLPTEKRNRIQQLQNENGRSHRVRSLVAMVGDAVNDAMAMSQADLR